MDDTQLPMSSLDPIKPRSRSSRTFVPARLFPKKLHILVAAGLTATLGLATLLPSEQAAASRTVVSLDLPELQEAPLDEDADLAADIFAAETDNMSLAHLQTVEIPVKSGDNLSAIFKRAGLKDRDMFELLNGCKEAGTLARLHPGHTFAFNLDENHRLMQLEHNVNKLQKQVFRRNGESSFSFELHESTPDVRTAIRSGTIETSLYQAGMDARINEQLIMELAGIFGWDVDFALDIRKGDRFTIVFEETFLDGDHLGNGKILAAEFVNQKNTFRAVRYVDESGRAEYYTPTGSAMRKAFLRAPLDFRRISSNFNPRRLHPISKTVRPHRGTDYAADRGTPIWASGDGRVVSSGFTTPNGNFVIIQHGSDIQTKYLHLDKRYVKKGDRVRQKQVIGTVGSTGFSTAPHLHYEFLVNGVHRDPRTIVQKLPKAQSIAEAELPRFYSMTQPILAELDSTTRMASADPAKSIQSL